MFGAIAGGIASALAGGAMSKLFGGGQKAASGGIQGDVLATDNNTVGMGDAGIKSDRKSGSAGMPRPISYAVFCLKKKTHFLDRPDVPEADALIQGAAGQRAPHRDKQARCAHRNPGEGVKKAA